MQILVLFCEFQAAVAQQQLLDLIVGNIAKSFSNLKSKRRKSTPTAATSDNRQGKDICMCRRTGRRQSKKSLQTARINIIDLKPYMLQQQQQTTARTFDFLVFEFENN